MLATFKVPTANCNDDVIETVVDILHDDDVMQGMSWDGDDSGIHFGNDHSKGDGVGVYAAPGDTVVINDAGAKILK